MFAISSASPREASAGLSRLVLGQADRSRRSLKNFHWTSWGSLNVEVINSKSEFINSKSEFITSTFANFEARAAALRSLIDFNIQILLMPEPIIARLSVRTPSFGPCTMNCWKSSSSHANFCLSKFARCVESKLELMIHKSNSYPPLLPRKNLGRAVENPFEIRSILSLMSYSRLLIKNSVKPDNVLLALL